MIYKNVARTIQLVAVAVLAACAGDPTATSTPLTPTAPYASDVSALMATTPLNRVVALKHDLTVARTIGSEGGTIRFPAAGLTLTVPAGAVSRSTRFSITALKGKAVAYEFQPHGTVFARSLIAQQSLLGTQPPLGGAVLQAGYFPNRNLVDPTGASALVSEFIPGAVDTQLVSFRWKIDHFSGYIVAW